MPDDTRQPAGVVLDLAGMRLGDPQVGVGCAALSSHLAHSRGSGDLGGDR